ncbi:hypothetical protein [Streptomyces sp. NBC_00459]
MPQQHPGRGLILGVIDTGIDPGNPSLAALPEPLGDGTDTVGSTVLTVEP